MLSSNLTKIPLLFFSLFVFFLFAEHVSAQPFSGTENVTISATVAPTTPIITPGAGGTTTGSYAYAGVYFSGTAYPNSKIIILQDGKLALIAVANSNSNFQTSLGNLPTGNYTFSVYSEDDKGAYSTPFIFTVNVSSGLITRVSGIFIPPTLSIDKSEIKEAKNLTVFGQAANNSDVLITVNGVKTFSNIVQSDNNGNYAFELDTSSLANGSYVIKSKATRDGLTSPESAGVRFTVTAGAVVTGEEPLPCEDCGIPDGEEEPEEPKEGKKPKLYFVPGLDFPNLRPIFILVVLSISLWILLLLYIIYRKIREYILSKIIKEESELENLITKAAGKKDSKDDDFTQNIDDILNPK